MTCMKLLKTEMFLWCCGAQSWCLPRPARSHVAAALWMWSVKCQSCLGFPLQTNPHAFSTCRTVSHWQNISGRWSRCPDQILFYSKLWAVDPEDVTAIGAQPGGELGYGQPWVGVHRCLQGRQYRTDRRCKFFWPPLAGKHKPAKGTCIRSCVYEVLYITIQLPGLLQFSPATNYKSTRNDTES